MSGEARRTIEQVATSAALVVVGLGLAACTSQEAGEALPMPGATAVSEQPEPAAAPAPMTPPLLTQRLTNMPGEKSFSFDLSVYPTENPSVIARPNQYDYAPSVTVDAEGKLKMWFCGGGGTGAHGGDSIWYSENYSLQGDPGSWSPPLEVIRPSDNPAHLDYAHVCDPSVVRSGGYDYVFYTGAADWAPNGGSCNGSPTADGCDNRIFAARVAIDATADAASYEKLVNISECVEENCFAWQSSQKGQAEYPPVPVIRGPGEQTPVWRRTGTGAAGATTQQTRAYGIGQPSVVNANGHLRMWYTNITETIASENIAVKPVRDITEPFDAQDQDAFIENTLSNLGNEVNYDVAYSKELGRFVVTIAEEHPSEPTSPLSRPRVGVAQYTGTATTEFYPPIMSNSLSNNTSSTACNCYTGGETNTHNSGFLRDEYGHLALTPGPDGSQYNWVYYGTNRSDPSQFNINRSAFTLASHK